MTNSTTEKPANWSAFTLQKIMCELFIISQKMELLTDMIYFLLSEEDMKKLVDFLTKNSVEFTASQREILIPLCLPDAVIKQFVEFEETAEEKIVRHKAEHQKRLVYFLENLYDNKIIIGLRAPILRKTVKLRKGDNSTCIDCFNSTEADLLKDDLCGYGFAVTTAQCDKSSLVVDLQASSVSKTSQKVVEFCIEMQEVGLIDVYKNTIIAYREQRLHNVTNN